jgi:hypothetical protein
VEGFSEGWAQLAARIKAAAGTIDYVDMDEPYYYGHFFDGPQACHWSTAKVVREVIAFIDRLHELFPNAVIGDAEPLVGQADARAYQDWIGSFKEINGSALPFLHIDVDWSRPAWPQEVKSIEEDGRRAGVAVGIIYGGNWSDRTDDEWLAHAAERVKRYEFDTGAHPDHVLFQSWHDKPDHLLPEETEFTFTHFISQYFADKAHLGYAQAPQKNLAYRKTARASGVDGVHTAANAVDGDPGTFWSAGGFPPKWIEVDLGEPADINRVRLTTSQTPAGPTTHEVYGKGPGTKGAWQLLHRFEGITSDGEDLKKAWPKAVTGIEFVRVVTTASPSWVGWREIEVVGDQPRP